MMNRQSLRVVFTCPGAWLVVFWLATGWQACHAQKTRTDSTGSRPNILWLSTEDIGPELNCYGDSTASTPALDALARQGVVYQFAWSNYPVCAPARTTIITGMYAATCGAGNMRSSILLPDGVKLFPKYLREAGYYCTNNRKEDYNYRDIGHQAWDESSGKAHYRNRQTDQPFFAVFNYTGTHESKIRTRPHKAVIDPATVTLKKYWPDTPEVRTDLAQYYDNLQVMDDWIAGHLQKLADAGLADDTIVIFFGDHGSGMPRHKRYAGDSGMRVPFVVHVPEKWKSAMGDDSQPGGRAAWPVGFIDLAPTMLSIAGVEPKSHMQGHAFLGEYKAEQPRYLYGYRDRMDERPDISRSIRDQRFIYVRNYMPHLPAGQFIEYQMQTPTTRIWKEQFDAGQLNAIQSHFWQPHPPEELYDLEADPQETINLVDDPKFADVLKRFRDEHRSSYLEFGDLGLIPEVTIKEIDDGGQSPRVILSNPASFPMERIFDAANIAADPTEAGQPAIDALIRDSNPTLRYWGLMGALIDGEAGFRKNAAAIVQRVDDDYPAAAIVAAEMTARFGTPDQRESALQRLLYFGDYRNSNALGAVAALNALVRLDTIAAPIQSELDELPQVDPEFKRGKSYLINLLKLLGVKPNATRSR